MCDCKKFLKDKEDTKCFLGALTPKEKWLPHTPLREVSGTEFYNFFFKTSPLEDIYIEIFARNEDYSILVFWSCSISNPASQEIKFRTFSEDLYCKHDNLFMTIDQFNDLIELNKKFKADTIFKYLKQIGFTDVSL